MLHVPPLVVIVPVLPPQAVLFTNKWAHW